MFMEALNSINKLTEPLFGDLKPDGSVNVYFNMSSGPGADLRGPWNSEPAFQYVADPLQHEQQEHAGSPGQQRDGDAAQPALGHGVGPGPRTGRRRPPLDPAARFDVRL